MALHSLRKVTTYMGLFDKLFGTYSDRELKRINPIADKIEALSDKTAALTDEQLRGHER